MPARPAILYSAAGPLARKPCQSRLERWTARVVKESSIACKLTGETVGDRAGRFNKLMVYVSYNPSQSKTQNRTFVTHLKKVIVNGTA